MGGTSATGNSYIDSLLQGGVWVGTITYSFPNARGDYESAYAEADAAGFGQVSFNQMQAVRSILEGASAYGGGPGLRLTSVESITNASLTDAGFDAADIRVAESSYANPTAYSYYPMAGNGYYAGDVWLGTSYDYSNAQVGNYEYVTLIHELGHSLGLKHAQDAGGVANTAMPADRDSLEFTVMTYRSYVGGPTSGYTNETYGFPQTYMMYDIAALQHLYGANFATNSGDTVYRWSPATGETFVNGVGQGAPGGGIGGSANRVFLTVWDGGGTDTYDLSAYGTNQSIDLTPGKWSLFSPVQQANLGDGHFARGNVFNALQYNGDARSLIENAIGGSGSDTIVGNAADNVLTGNGGNDTLDGGAGADTAVYSGRRADYQVSLQADGSFQVQDLRIGSPDGTDRLIGFESFRFAEGAVGADGTDHFANAGSWTNAGRGDEPWYAGDFNGDGRDDVFRYWSGESGARMFLSDGHQFVDNGSWTGAGHGPDRWYAGDFNGDGRDDVFRYLPGQSGADMFLSTGSGFQGSGSWTGAGRGDEPWYVGDFNGDGKDDIFRYWSGESGARVFLSNGSGFMDAGSWTGAGHGAERWYVGDFNGDGRDDVFRYAPGRSGAEMFLSTGSAFVAAGSWTGEGHGDEPWHVGDYNGDGMDDLLRTTASGTEVLLSDGSQFSSATTWTSVNGSGLDGWYVGNFDGTVGDDIFRYQPGVSGADMFLGV